MNQLEKDIREIYPDRLTYQKTIPTFHPEAPEEAAELFRWADRCGQKLFISGFGNNIDPVGRPFADRLVLKSDRLNCIHKIGAGDFFVTVGAGYPLKELNKVLAAQQLWFPFGEANYAGSCGGAVAAGLSAWDGHHPVPLSRSLLTVTAVLPDGSIVRPGAVTFKSVSGFDISRLFYNSWGSLGMIIQLSFRVLPLAKRVEAPRLILQAPDSKAFVDSLTGDNRISFVLRSIKDELDPHNLLPIQVIE